MSIKSKKCPLLQAKFEENSIEIVLKNWQIKKKKGGGKSGAKSGIKSVQ